MASAFGILCIMILVRLFILIECLVVILIYSKKCFVRQFESNNYLTFFVNSNQHNFTFICTMYIVHTCVLYWDFFS